MLIGHDEFRSVESLAVLGAGIFESVILKYLNLQVELLFKTEASLTWKNISLSGNSPLTSIQLGLSPPSKSDLGLRPGKQQSIKAESK